jgi:hypothetical protein
VFEESLKESEFEIKLREDNLFVVEEIDPVEVAQDEGGKSGNS